MSSSLRIWGNVKRIEATMLPDSRKKIDDLLNDLEYQLSHQEAKWTTLYVKREVARLAKERNYKITDYLVGKYLKNAGGVYAVSFRSNGGRGSYHSESRERWTNSGSRPNTRPYGGYRDGFSYYSEAQKRFLFFKFFGAASGAHFVPVGGKYASTIAEGVAIVENDQKFKDDIEDARNFFYAEVIRLAYMRYLRGINSLDFIKSNKGSSFF